MDPEKSEVLQGTLDRMILKTLHGLGPLHGFGIARLIERARFGSSSIEGWLRSGARRKTAAKQSSTPSPGVS
jgi:hypothetical protein